LWLDALVVDLLENCILIVRKIISGGQTGADQSGLFAGLILGIETGGTAPYNWMTEKGPDRLLLEGFGLVAGPYDPWTFRLRTRLNVINSDGTVIFGRVSSSGTKLTIKYLNKDNKPYICNPSAIQLLAWIQENHIQILNVAGNREGTNPGIFKSARDTIIAALV
jgi:hypothetical protein